jgi:hypothetical protein
MKPSRPTASCMNMPPPPPSVRSLADYQAFQRAMAAALLRPLTPANGMGRTAPGGGSMRDYAAAFVKPNDRLTSFERLEIYNRQYWFRVLDCLHDDFPGLRALLGQRKFTRLCEAYLAENPSESWTLRNLAGRLAAFIEANPDLSAPHTEAAADMARFEWAQILAFDEARRPPLTVDDLLDRDAPTLRLGLQPHLSLLDLDHAVDEFAFAAKEGEQGLRGEASNAQESAREHAPPRRGKSPARRRIRLAVHRFDNSIFSKRLEPVAFLLLASLQAGFTLTAALDHALRDADPAPDWAAIVRRWFENWAALGWFCKPAPKSSTPAHLF